MNDNKKFLAGLILGAAAGVALTVFFSGKKGKEVLEEVKDTAEDWGDTIKSKLDSFGKEVSDLLEKGKSFVEEAENKAKDIIS